MIEFRMKVVNSAGIHFAFAGLADGVRDWRTHIWPAVRSRAIRPWLRSQFAERGRGEHGRWAELKEPYRTRKERQWPGKGILEASGKMKEDLLSEDNDGVETDRTLEYGTSVAYALFHQTGTKNMVARRIFDPEIADERGSLKQLIRGAVAFGVSNHARALGFAVAGGDVGPVEAAAVGRNILRGGGLRGFLGGRFPVSGGM